MGIGEAVSPGEATSHPTSHLPTAETEVAVEANAEVGVVLAAPSSPQGVQDTPPTHPRLVAIATTDMGPIRGTAWHP